MSYTQQRAFLIKQRVLLVQEFYIGHRNGNFTILILTHYGINHNNLPIGHVV